MSIGEGHVDHVKHIDRNNSVIREVSRPEARSFECVEQEIDTQHAEVALNQYRVADVGGLGWRIDASLVSPQVNCMGYYRCRICISIVCWIEWTLWSRNRLTHFSKDPSKDNLHLRYFKN